jgi:hypothetical protein
MRGPVDREHPETMAAVGYTRINGLPNGHREWIGFVCNSLEKEKAFLSEFLS